MLARIITRALSSFCLMAGVLALFIYYHGGTVRLRTPGFSTAPNQAVHNEFIITLPHALPIAVALTATAVLLFVVSRKLQKKQQP